MCGNFPRIKVVEGNAFAVVIPLKRLTFVSCRPIEDDIDPTQLTDVIVMYGGVQMTVSIGIDGVSFISPADKPRGIHNIILTAKYQGTDIRAAYEGAIEIVAWNSQSNAQQFVQGSPVVLDAAYVIGGALTDAELEALKEQYRHLNVELGLAIQAEADAKAEWERKAAELEGVAQEQTLTQGVQDIREDISHIDIDTSTLAKETSVKDGNDTVISVSKEVRSEVGTGSDTAAESGTLFAILKWVKDKVKSIYNLIGTPASGQPATLFAAIAAAGGGGGDAQESTSQAILSLVQQMTTANILHASADGFAFLQGYEPTSNNLAELLSKLRGVTNIDNDAITEFSGPLADMVLLDMPNLLNATFRGVDIVRGTTSQNAIYYGANGSLVLNFPNATKFISESRAFQARGNLGEILMPNVTTFASSQFTFAAATYLRRIQVGAIATSFSIGTWSPSSLPTSQFLPYIKPDIADRIADLTGQTSQTITFSAAVKAAIQADTATSNAFTNKNWTIA